MAKDKEDGLRMRGQDEEVRTTEDGVQSEGGDVGTQDQGPDTGQGSGVAPLPPHLRSPAARGQGQGINAGEQVEWQDLRPITNKTIIAKKQEVDRLERQLQEQIAMLRGMLTIDADVERLNVDLDRMVYQVPKTDLA